MRRFRLGRRSAIAIVVGCLLVVALCAPLLEARMAAESSMPNIAVAVTDSALVEADADADDLAALRAAGVDTVVLGMRPISEVADVTVKDGDALVRYRDGSDRLDGPIASLGFVLAVRFGIASDSGTDGVHPDGDRFTVSGLNRPQDVADAPAGFDPARAEFLARAGMRVIPALPSVPGSGLASASRYWLGEELRELIDVVEAADPAAQVSSVSVLGSLSGEDVPASTVGLLEELGQVPDSENDLGRFLRADRFDLVVPDLVDVSGVAELAEPGKVVRAHVVAVGPTDSAEPGSVLSVRVDRAVKERGIRLIVLRGPPEELKATLTPEHLTAVASGILRSEPGSTVPSAMPAVQGIGGEDGPVFGLQVAMLLVGIGGATAAVLIALAAGGTGGARGSGGVRRPLAAYGLAGLVSVTTGLVVAALGSRSDFLTGLETFRGIKLLLVVPVGILACLAVWRNRDRTDLLRWRNLVIGGLGVAALGYYLVRSGNSGLAPGWELWIRDRLDEAMYVRPRFKEALIGLPALFLTAALVGRARWVVAPIAAVGTASVVDTFAHFAMPLPTAGLRTVYGFAIGLAVGLLGWHLWRRRRASGPVSTMNSTTATEG